MITKIKKPLALLIGIINISIIKSLPHEQKSVTKTK